MRRLLLLLYNSDGGGGVLPAVVAGRGAGGAEALGSETDTLPTPGLSRVVATKLGLVQAGLNTQ